MRPKSGIEIVSLEFSDKTIPTPFLSRDLSVCRMLEIQTTSVVIPPTFINQTSAEHQPNVYQLLANY